MNELPAACRNRLGEHKIGYATWEDGEQACYELWSKPTFLGRVLFAYPAPCGQYHVGHDRISPPEPRHVPRRIVFTR